MQPRLIKLLARLLLDVEREHRDERGGVGDLCVSAVSTIPKLVRDARRTGVVPHAQRVDLVRDQVDVVLLRKECVVEQYLFRICAAPGVLGRAENLESAHAVEDTRSWMGYAKV